MTKTHPKISIITPSYNQGDYIEQTIQSVLNQNYPNLEFIIMDGGSTDQTLDIIKKYEKHLTWVSEPDKGQSNAINKGFAKATGDILAFINTDDTYEPNTLHTVANYFMQHPDAYWLTGKCRNIDKNSNEIRKLITHYKNFWLQFRSYKILTILNYVSQPATFWRRELMQTTGPMSENLNYAMDYDYWLRAGQHYKLHFVNQYLANFRIHPTSKAGASANAQFDAEIEIVKQYVDSNLILGLHKLHCGLTVGVYRQLLAKEHQLPT